MGYKTSLKNHLETTREGRGRLSHTRRDKIAAVENTRRKKTEIEKEKKKKKKTKKTRAGSKQTGRKDASEKGEFNRIVVVVVQVKEFGNSCLLAGLQLFFSSF